MKDYWISFFVSGIFAFVAYVTALYGRDGLSLIVAAVSVVLFAVSMVWKSDQDNKVRK